MADKIANLEAMMNVLSDAVSANTTRSIANTDIVQRTHYRDTLVNNNNGTRPKHTAAVMMDEHTATPTCHSPIHGLSSTVVNTALHQAGANESLIHPSPSAPPLSQCCGSGLQKSTSEVIKNTTRPPQSIIRSASLWSIGASSIKCWNCYKYLILMPTINHLN